MENVKIRVGKKYWAEAPEGTDMENGPVLVRAIIDRNTAFAFFDEAFTTIREYDVDEAGSELNPKKYVLFEILSGEDETGLRLVPFDLFKDIAKRKM